MSPSHKASSWALAALALMAPALGGCTSWPALAVLLCCTGLLFLCAPPKSSPGRAINLVFLGLIALSLAPFLPSDLFGTPAWRQHLLAIGIDPGNVGLMLSPQPFLSLEWTALFWCSLSLAYYCLAYRWDQNLRVTCAKLYVFGITALAAVAIYAFLSKSTLPLWPDQTFGFFPNRNHSANVLALCAAAMTGVILADKMNGRERYSLVLGIIGLVILGAALVLDTSRAGIALFFSGVFATAAAPLLSRYSAKAASLWAAALCLLLAAFLLFGGATLDRFQGEPGQWAGTRTAIQHDALNLSLNEPWLGHGPGNFTRLFAMYRVASTSQIQALHPESDWLWIAVEQGWITVALLLAVLGLWLKACLPLKGHPFRLGCAFAGIGFALHSMVDVAGHRPGALWPTFFLMSLALNPARSLNPDAWVTWLYRAWGAVVSVAAAYCLFLVIQPKAENITPAYPASMALEELEIRRKNAVANGDYAALLNICDTALNFAPLDWAHYFNRAVAELMQDHNVDEAARDFAIARKLQPDWIDISLQEGALWVEAVEVERGLQAWADALERQERSGTRGTAVYERMLAACPDSPAALEGVGVLGRNNPEFHLAYTLRLGSKDLDAEIAQWLQSSPDLQTLSEDQLRLLLRHWYLAGNKAEAVAAIKSRPAWTKLGGQWLAADAAARGDFQEAYQFAIQGGNIPTLPKLPDPQPLEEAERRFFYQSDNIQLGLALYASQMHAGDTAGALKTVTKLAKLKGAPAYLIFLQSQLEAQMGKWESAWNTWLRYQSVLRA